MMRRYCENCGGILPPRHRVYCSQRCKEDASRHLTSCVHCGAPTYGFGPGRRLCRRHAASFRRGLAVLLVIAFGTLVAAVAWVLTP